MKRLLLIILIFFSFNTFAADWVPIFSSDNFDIFIDKLSIHHKKKAWLKYESKGSMKNKFAYMLQLVLVDCNENRSALKTYAAYKKDGTVLYSYEDPAPLYKTIIPESIGEGILVCICNDNSNEIIEALKTIQLSGSKK